MFQPLANWAQKRYQQSLSERLRDYGLRYDDLYDPLMDMVRRYAARMAWGSLHGMQGEGSGAREGEG